VAAGLINGHERLGADNVVVVDASEGALRLGYGVAEASLHSKNKASPFVMPRGSASPLS